MAAATDTAEAAPSSEGDTQVVRKRTVLMSVIVTAAAVAPIADALRIAPLTQRDGVVVTYRAKNKVAVVAQPNGRLIAIHSLRRVTPGTRVTVQGIKWGTPTSGIKWGLAPRGIKWGIKWGRNGSYQSGLRRRSTRKAVWTPVRGPIVKKFGRKAVAVGTPGGVVVVRVAQRRGLANSSLASLHAPSLPPVGATISVRTYFGPNGIKVGRELRYLKPPVPGAELPFAGDVVAIDAAGGTLVLADDQDPAYRVRIRVSLPPEFTIAPYRLGQSLAVEGTVRSDGAVAATLIGPNTDFAAADDPTAVQILTSDDPACTQAVGAPCPAATDPASGTVPAPAPPDPSSPSTSPPPSPSPTTPPPGTSPPPARCRMVKDPKHRLSRRLRGCEQRPCARTSGLPRASHHRCDDREDDAVRPRGTR